MSYQKHRDKIFRKYRGKCWMCGGHGSTIDHIVPQHLGGSDHPDNLRPACAKCNTQRNASTSPFRYDRLPSLQALAKAGSVTAYRGRVLITPRMYSGGQGAVRRLREQVLAAESSPGLIASRMLVAIGRAHTEAACRWIDSGQPMSAFLAEEDDLIRGLTRRIFVPRSSRMGPITGTDFVEMGGWIVYVLGETELPSDWNDFHFERCPRCDAV